MKPTHKIDFLKVSTTSFTIISLVKLVIDLLLGQITLGYFQNFMNILLISILAILILSLHYHFLDAPFLLVLVLQYVLYIAIIMSIVWFNSLFISISPNTYSNMFWSATIPYAIGCLIHYLRFFYQLKKANHIISHLNIEQTKL